LPIYQKLPKRYVHEYESVHNFTGFTIKKYNQIDNADRLLQGRGIKTFEKFCWQQYTSERTLVLYKAPLQ